MVLVSKLRPSVTGLRVIFRRNIGLSAVVAAKAANVTDPIQKLFMDKLHEYKAKASKLKEGELVDSNSEIQARKKFEMDNLHRRYGGQNMEEFPKFSFEK